MVSIVLTVEHGKTLLGTTTYVSCFNISLLYLLLSVRYILLCLLATCSCLYDLYSDWLRIRYNVYSPSTSVYPAIPPAALRFVLHSLCLKASFQWNSRITVDDRMAGFKPYPGTHELKESWQSMPKTSFYYWSTAHKYMHSCSVYVYILFPHSIARPTLHLTRINNSPLLILECSKIIV